MLIFVQIDLADADFVAFERYEDQMLALLLSHGGRMLQRLRSGDGQAEYHLLEFSDAACFDAFQADPLRCALQPLLLASRAQARAVRVVDYPC